MDHELILVYCNGEKMILCSMGVDEFPDGQEDFELDSLLNGEPVQLIELCGHVIILAAKLTVKYIHFQMLF